MLKEHSDIYQHILTFTMPSRAPLSFSILFAQNSGDCLWICKLRSAIFFSKEHSTSESKSFQVLCVNSMVTCFYNWLIALTKDIWLGFYNRFKKKPLVVGAGILWFSQSYIKKITFVHDINSICSKWGQIQFQKGLKNINHLFLMCLLCMRVHTSVWFACVSMFCEYGFVYERTAIS